MAAKKVVAAKRVKRPAKHVMSEKGRAAIRKAQIARWKKYRAEKKKAA